MTDLTHSSNAKKVKRAGVYVRVSTASRTKHGDTLTFDQDPAVQEQPPRELVAQRAWTIYRAYPDRASGAKERRPGLDALMSDARRGAFDVVVVWRFDRFARSVKQLVLALDEFRSMGIVAPQDGVVPIPTAAEHSVPCGQLRLPSPQPTTNATVGAGLHSTN